MGSAGASAYNGGLGNGAPSWGPGPPGAEPWVRGSGVKPPEDYFTSGHSTDLQSLPVFQYFTAFSAVHLGARRSPSKKRKGNAFLMRSASI